MLRTFMTAYPWDLVDEGVTTVLDRLRGEVGVTGISVWMASPTVTQLRARPGDPRIFRTRGGVFFHPDEEAYAATRCKPIVSGWLKGKEPLKRIAEACAERGMDLRVVVSAAMAGRLAQRHPEMACKNVFGDESHASLCLVHPDVQAYLGGLLYDLSSNYRLTGIVITDFVIAWSDASLPGLRTPRPLGEAETLLLSTCFCESCHQRASEAGVDVGMARRSVEATLQHSLEARPEDDTQMATLLADDVPLTDYHRWRTRELSSLLERLTQQCGCELLLSKSMEGSEQWQHSDLDSSIPAAVITRIERHDQLTAALCPAAKRGELYLSEMSVTGAHGPELVSTLAKAVERGFSGVTFENYGLLPDTALTPIKQAIRFARRSART